MPTNQPREVANRCIVGCSSLTSPAARSSPAPTPARRRRSPTPGNLVASLEGLLLRPQAQAGAGDRAQLPGRLAAIKAEFQACRYAAVAHALPALIADSTPARRHRSLGSSRARRGIQHRSEHPDQARRTRAGVDRRRPGHHRGPRQRQPCGRRERHPQHGLAVPTRTPIHHRARPRRPPVPHSPASTAGRAADSRPASRPAEQNRS
jgi:hypothetical protein